MANLNERLFISLPLDQVFFDKDSAQPLANGTIEFYRDSSRVTPKAVYQLSGTEPDYTYTALPNPITLSAVGNIVNAAGFNKTLYFFPYTGTPDNPGDEIDLYYILCKNADGVEQWTREGWPNIHSGNDPTQDPFPVQNQIANSQFTRMLINEGLTTTYTVSGATDQAFEFAPDWQFLISGTGTVEVSRTAVTGSARVKTNPPYYITVTVGAGVSACKLVQRMNFNSGLWSSTTGQQVYLAGNVVAQSVGTASSLVMSYIESTGGSALEIFNANVSTADFETYQGTSDAVPESSNTNSGSAGFVDIYLSFPTASTTRVTSVQVVPTLSSGGGDELQYDPNSSNREQALMGDYYIPRLEAKRQNSLLVGWDFPFNPRQYNLTGNITTTPAYKWDRTIGVANSANVAYAANTVTDGLQLTTGGTADAFYLMQYMDAPMARKILGTRLSVNVWGYKTAGTGNVTMRVYLVRGSSSASFPALPTVIGTFASTGIFTITASNWTEINRSGLGVAQATLSTVSAGTDLNLSVNDYGFSGWEITDASQINNTDKFAIIVSFAYPADAITMVINSISLVPGDLPTRPNILTKNETLLNCERYFRKSFPLGTMPANNAGEDGAIRGTQTNPASTASTIGVWEHFATPMRAAPLITGYNPIAGTAGQLVTGGSAVWNSTGIGQFSTRGFYANGTTPGGTNRGESTSFHYTANAELGIV